MQLKPEDNTADLANTLGECRSGANWFFWIAGLSLVNSAILLSGSDSSFIIGLGITQIFDLIGVALAEEFGPVVKVITFAFSAVAAGSLVLFGVLARKAMRWAFVTGMVLYALDGGIFLLAADWLSVGFHALALFYIFRGFQAAGELRKAAQSPPPVLQQPSLADQMVTQQLESERPAA